MLTYVVTVEALGVRKVVWSNQVGSEFSARQDFIATNHRLETQASNMNKATMEDRLFSLC